VVFKAVFRFISLFVNAIVQNRSVIKFGFQHVKELNLIHYFTHFRKFIYLLNNALKAVLAFAKINYHP